jgi:uroporphyrinogen decarboxylase
MIKDTLYKMMKYDYPTEIPFSTWVTPAAWFKYGEDMFAFARQNSDFIHMPESLNEVRRNMAATYNAGKHTDNWGCVWENTVEGTESLVTGHPLKERRDIHSFSAPETLAGYLPHGFMYLRLLDLRGFEEIMVDFAEECDELQILIGKVLDYNCREIENILTKTDHWLISFGDDLGMQNGLAIGAERWRKYLKPCFKRMYRFVKDSGKYVYMHTDGDICEIIPDLFECGVDILNPQIRANGLENLERVCKGKYPINLDLDRQLFPFASPSELRDHVREAVEALYLPEGGLAVYIELGHDVPLENMEALLSEARKMKKGIL